MQIKKEKSNSKNYVKSLLKKFIELGVSSYDFTTLVNFLSRCVRMESIDTTDVAHAVWNHYQHHAKKKLSFLELVDLFSLWPKKNLIQQYCLDNKMTYEVLKSIRFPSYPETLIRFVEKIWPDNINQLINEYHHLIEPYAIEKINTLFPLTMRAYFERYCSTINERDQRRKKLSIFPLTVTERYFELNSFTANYTTLIQSPASKDQALQEVTCLYFGNVDKKLIDAAFAFIEREPLNALSAIEIANFSPDQEVELLRLLKHFETRPSLLLYLPESAQSLQKDIPKNFTIIFSHKKITIPKLVSESKITSSTQKQVISEVKSEFVPTDIYVAKNGLNTRIDSSLNTESYEMTLAGELLNPESSKKKISIRTGIIEMDFNTLTQSYEEPTKLTRLNNIKYSDKKTYESIVADCRKQKDHRFVQFHQMLTANKPVRLLSVDANEKLKAYHSEPYVLIDIKKGDDGFFYATAKTDCALHFVLEADLEESLQNAYDTIPDKHVAKKIITQFKKHPRFHDTKNDEPIPKTATGGIDWNTAYDQCLGSCQHRVAAVYKKIMEQLKGNHDDVRIVYIDNNHLCLEIKYKGTWCQVDLGGSQAELTYTNAQTIYQAIPDPKPLKKQSPEFKSPLTSLLIWMNLSQKPTEVIPISAPNKPPYKPRDLHPILTLHSANKLLQNIFSSTAKTILIAPGHAAELTEQTYYLMKAIRKNGHRVFYLNDPNAFDIEMEQIWLDTQGQPHFGIHSLLDNFLKTSGENDVLMIHWEAFSTQQRLQLNYLFERMSRFKGKIASFCEKIPTEDGSFTSRHNLLLDTQDVSVDTVSNDNEQKSDTPIITIDLKGFEDWKETLFGKIIQTREGTKWKKSKFVHLLEENKNIDIQIQNASDPIALEAYLQQAKAVGHFAYHGYLIPIKNDNKVRFSCHTQPFHFKEFAPVLVEKNITIEEIEDTTSMIDSDVFDILLTGKKIENGAYEETDGLIKRHAKKPLTLFISATLTDAQYHVLLTTAKKHSVALTLQLAPHVTLPKEIQTLTKNGVSLEKKEDKVTRVFLTATPDKKIEEILSRGHKPLVLHVEDYHFSDLIYNISYETTDLGFKNFQVIKSDMLLALKNGRDVILRGEFSESLLAELKPILLGRPLHLPDGEVVTLTGNLTILMDPHHLLNLNWLSSNSIEQYDFAHTVKHKTTPIVLFEEKTPLQTTVNLSQSRYESDLFIHLRKNHLFGGLMNYTMLQLVGESGVGKSHLLDDIEADKNCHIYREFSNIESWARDRTSQIIILFIDEVNIENRHLTLFAPLKNKKNAEGVEILYLGKLYTLTQYHKIVFARNPCHYGGGRVQQCLFDDNTIPEIHLADFPDAYIYERILKPIFDHTLPNHSSRLFQDKESVWKEICTKHIQAYRNHQPRDTVRELQEKVLQEVKGNVLLTLPTNLVGFPGTPTEEQLRVIESLKSFIQIKRLLRETHDDRLKGLGLNGYLLEGKPGTGKTEMIECALKSLGYQEATLEREHRAADAGLYFYRIRANSSLVKKKEILIKALVEGNPFFVDELDSCIDDGFEKILNAVLTGKHPDGIISEIKPGCIGLFTANGAGLLGRDLIGPAVRHRCVIQEASDHSKNGIRQIFTEKFPADSPEKIEDRVDEFMYLQKEKSWNLRGYFALIQRECCSYTSTLSH